MAEAPSFIERDPDKIVSEMVTDLEARLGKTLYPAQVERLLVDFIAYRELLIREAIQDAASQNLVKFARGKALDELGMLLGCKRIMARPASVTAYISCDVDGLVLPAGFRCASSDGIIFELVDSLRIPSGGCAAELRTVDRGDYVNGIPAGHFLALDRVDGYAGSLSIESKSFSEGGANKELDDHFRQRIMLAPESFTTAGSHQSYRYHARSAHPDVIDVRVLSPTPGDICIYPLMSSGAPDASVLSAIYDSCSADRVRPLSDLVAVLAPTPVHVVIDAVLVLDDEAVSADVLALADARCREYMSSVSSRLGRDIVPSAIIAALSVPGVYEVRLMSPAAVIRVSDAEWGVLESLLLREGRSL